MSKKVAYRYFIFVLLSLGLFLVACSGGTSPIPKDPKDPKEVKAKSSFVVNGSFKSNNLSNQSFGARFDVSGDNAIALSRTDGREDVHFFERNDDTWTEVKTFMGSDGVGVGIQGIAVSESYAIIGESFLREDLFKVYIYERTNSGWQRQESIILKDTSFFSGETVAITEDYAVILADSKVLTYERNGSNWQLSQKPATTLATQQVANSLDEVGRIEISGDYLIVTGVIFNADLKNVGVVLVYERINNAWVEVLSIDKLEFGPLALAGYLDNIAIHEEHLFIVTYDGYNEIDFTSEESIDVNRLYNVVGRVHAYKKSNQGWSKTQEFSSGMAGDLFGFSVSAYDDLLAVGAVGNASNKGAVYIYQLAQDRWQETTKLVLSESEAGDAFGVSTVLIDKQLFVSAPISNNGAGAVYVYNIE